MVTVSFLTLMFVRMFHVFNMRGWRSKLFTNDIITNPFVWGATALCFLLILAAVYIPPLANVLSVETPGTKEWTMVAVAGVIPLVLIQMVKSAVAFYLNRYKPQTSD
jgi:Ca2+-transporting ATPase